LLQGDKIRGRAGEGGADNREVSLLPVLVPCSPLQARQPGEHRIGRPRHEISKENYMNDAIQVRALESLGEREIRGLSEVLIDCVEGGASVSFMLPMTRAKADAFWQGVASSAARGERTVLVADDANGNIVGTVQVLLNQPENQPHRGDIAKMLVHRRGRRHGVGAALLAAAERSAMDSGKTLLVLDTVTGGDAERMYVRQGWQRCGEIPGYALWPDGRPCATTIYFKSLHA
jgi:GNAT superfamily N-acetyltransferase